MLDLPTSFFRDESEQVRGILGREYLKTISGQVSSSGSTMVLSDRHLYHEGKRLERGNGGKLVRQKGTKAVAIKDVRQIPASPDEVKWADMPKVLDESAEIWNEEDVAAYTAVPAESDEASTGEIVFYLNAENAALEQAERGIMDRRSETSIEAIRQHHRVLLCYHLYQLAIAPEEEAEDTADEQEMPLPEESRHLYANYRGELIRLNDTLLYAQREFLLHLLERGAGEGDE